MHMALVLYELRLLLKSSGQSAQLRECQSNALSFCCRDAADALSKLSSLGVCVCVCSESGARGPSHGTSAQLYPPAHALHSQV